ncbi:hypothetical protein ACXWRJ_09495, partial [Streptococcus pyogenes]
KGDTHNGETAPATSAVFHSFRKAPYISAFFCAFGYFNTTTKRNYYDLKIILSLFQVKRK